MTMLNTTTRYAAPAIRRGAAVILASLGRFVDRVIAHRERQANLVALRHLTEKSALSSRVFFKDKLHGACPEPPASLKE